MIVALPGLFYYLFYYINVGFKGVKIIEVCFRDVKLFKRSLQNLLAEQFMICNIIRTLTHILKHVFHRYCTTYA